MAAYFCVWLIIITFAIADTSGVLDFTCFSSYPRININGNDNMRIGGYRSGDDKDSSVSFGRLSSTGTGSGLPSGSSERDHPVTEVSARLLDMPQSGGKERIGAFYCEAQKDNMTERIIATVMASNNEITPEHISQTVSIGESVSFVMGTTVSDLRWRHNGGDVITDWNGNKQVTIDSVSVGDAGVYECHRYNHRSDGVHAIFQLIVKACVSSKWGPACTNDCPLCFNDGVCDERSGGCVCAPGFTGNNCENVLGSNRWGQDGGLRCSAANGNDPHSTACAGNLFCLPHPYGCSCVAGYQGIDCNEECPDGFYGAGCKSECHCAAGVSCLKDTGECDGGRCLEGWSGVNCQQRCADPGQVSSIRILPQGNTLQVDWEHEESLCIDKRYVIEIELINLDQCQLQTTNPKIEAGEVISTSFNIEGLQYYSSYAVYIKSTLNGTVSGTSSPGITETTGQAEPSSFPSDVRLSAVTHKTITFTWSQPPCGQRHGKIVSYAYILSTKGDNEIIRNSTELTSVKIGGLDPLTNYTFTVAAVNEAGKGPPYTLYVMTNKQAAPSAPVLEVIETTTTSISVKWQEPKYLNGVLEKYYVQSRTITKPYDLNFTPASIPEQELALNNIDQTSYTFSGLKPSTKYEIKVFAHSVGGGSGEAVIIAQFTDVAAATDMSKPTPLPSIMTNQVTISTIEIRVQRGTSEFITGYQVGIESKAVLRKRQTREFGHYKTSNTMYVAAELQKDAINDDYVFIIGDNKTYGMFYNAPLNEGQTYTIYTAYVSRINSTTYGVSWSDGTDVTTPSYNTDSVGLTVTTIILVCIIHRYYGCCYCDNEFYNKIPLQTPEQSTQTR